MAHLKIKEKDDLSGGKKKVGLKRDGPCFFFSVGFGFWCGVKASGSAWMGWGWIGG